MEEDWEWEYADKVDWERELGKRLVESRKKGLSKCELSSLSL